MIHVVGSITLPPWELIAAKEGEMIYILGAIAAVLILGFISVFAYRDAYR